MLLCDTGPSLSHSVSLKTLTIHIAHLYLQTASYAFHVTELLEQLVSPCVEAIHFVASINQLDDLNCLNWSLLCTILSRQSLKTVRTLRWTFKHNYSITEGERLVPLLIAFTYLHAGLLKNAEAFVTAKLARIGKPLAFR